MKRPSRDPYEILGVASDASEKALRSKYRKLCKLYHPDLNHGDPRSAEIFKEMKWAYETILAGLDPKSAGTGPSADFPEAYRGECSKHPFYGFFDAVKAYCEQMNLNKES